MSSTRLILVETLGLLYEIEDLRVRFLIGGCLIGFGGADRGRPLRSGNALRGTCAGPPVLFRCLRARASERTVNLVY